MLEPRPVLLPLALAWTATSAHAGNVLLVDATNPPGTYATIQAAIDVSVDGDAILVRSGTYARFELPDRELSIVADQGAIVNVVGAPRVVSLGVGRTLFLGGLDIVGAYGLSGLAADGMILQNAAGAVRVEDCSIAAAIAQPIDNCSPRRGLVLSGCADIALTRCEIRGQSGANFDFAKGGIGLSAVSSKIALHDCIVLGGNGGGADACGQQAISNDLNCVYSYAYVGDGADGGPGCRLVGSEMLMTGSVIQGGNGGATHGTLVCFYAGGCGGAGIETSGLVAIWGLSSAPLGGLGMPSTPGGPPCPLDGLPGPPMTPSAAVLTTLPGVARSFRTPRVVRAGQPLHVRLDGLPGDHAVVLLDADPARVPALSLLGWYHLHPPPGSRFLRVGTLDGSGALDRDLVAPGLAPGELARTVFFQTIHRDVSGGVTLGPSQTVVVIDASL